MAAKLNPNDPDFLAIYCLGLCYLGYLERAIEIGELAIELNPTSPDYYLECLGSTYFVAQRYQDSVSYLESVPDAWIETRAYLVAAHAYLENDNTAREHKNIFLRNVKDAWKGDPTAGPRDYVEWFFHISPFRRQQDIDHFRIGFRKAGLAA